MELCVVEETLCRVTELLSHLLPFLNMVILPGVGTSHKHDHQLGKVPERGRLQTLCDVSSELLGVAGLSSCKQTAAEKISHTLSFVLRVRVKLLT